MQLISKKVSGKMRAEKSSWEVPKTNTPCPRKKKKKESKHQKLSGLNDSGIDSVVCSYILSPLFPVLDTEDKNYSKV